MERMRRGKARRGKGRIGEVDENVRVRARVSEEGGRRREGGERESQWKSMCEQASVNSLSLSLKIQRFLSSILGFNQTSTALPTQSKHNGSVVTCGNHF